jgi:DNA-binding XRE family transcriptional regulator
MSAAWLYEMRLGQVDNAEFRALMKALRLTLERMAAHLGQSRRTIAAYRKDKAIPRFVALPVRYLLEKHFSVGGSGRYLEGPINPVGLAGD